MWDVYLNGSLKGTARLKRGEGVRRRVVRTGVIPGNWQDFLRVDSNKTELFSYLSQIVAQMLIADDKQVYVCIQVESRFSVIQEKNIMQV